MGRRGCVAASSELPASSRKLCEGRAKCGVAGVLDAAQQREALRVSLNEGKDEQQLGEEAEQSVQPLDSEAEEESDDEGAQRDGPTEDE